MDTLQHQNKSLSFKFYFDNKRAFVTLDIEDDLEQRINCWENLVSLKSILLNEYLQSHLRWSFSKMVKKFRESISHLIKKYPSIIKTVGKK